MPKFRYAKLVRNNVPSKHLRRGHTVDGRQLSGDDLRAALIDKLHEEADEVSGALSRQELIEEIGDVQQIIYDLCTTQGILLEEIAQSIKEKVDRNGGYANGEFINSVAMPNEDDKWVKYCRRYPEKYPEVS